MMSNSESETRMFNSRSFYRAILTSTRRNSGLPTYDESLADLRRLADASLDRRMFSRL